MTPYIATILSPFLIYGYCRSLERLMDYLERLDRKRLIVEPPKHQAQGRTRKPMSKTDGTLCPEAVRVYKKIVEERQEKLKELKPVDKIQTIDFEIIQQ